MQKGKRMKNLQVPLEVLKGIARVDPFLWEDAIDNYCCEFCDEVLPYHSDNCPWEFIANLVLETPEWVEEYSIDPRDGGIYFARVNSRDYKSKDEARRAAMTEADRLALRGYEK